MIILGVTKVGVEIRGLDDGKPAPAFNYIKYWKRHAPKNILEQQVVISSSMNWPRDYTDEISIIELSDVLAGNNVSGLNPKFDRTI
jgi:hypothetical protein